MAKKKILTMKDIGKLSDEELAIEVHDARRVLFTLSSQAVTEKIEDTSQFRKKKTHIARLLTAQHIRNAAGSPAS